MNLKAYIFDLDGVLVSTDRYHYIAWKTIADELGIYFDEEINNRLRGVSRMESLNIILERYSGDELSEEKKLELTEKKNGIYKELLKQMKPSDVSEGVRDTLSELKKRGHRLAVGSSSKNTGFILEKTELAGYFDAVSDGNNISRSKPDPEVFIKAAGYLKTEPENCIVVEDAYAGIDAAKAGNMYAVGIGDAAGYEMTDLSISDLTQLLDI